MTVNAFERQVLEDLAEIKTKMNVVVGEDGNGGRIGDHEKRLRGVERRWWRAAGFYAAISLAAAMVFSWFKSHFPH